MGGQNLQRLQAEGGCICLAASLLGVPGSDITGVTPTGASCPPKVVVTGSRAEHPFTTLA
eukprot:1619939-Amphidinium_carterae.1